MRSTRTVSVRSRLMVLACAARWRLLSGELLADVEADALVHELRRRDLRQVDLARLVEAGLDHLLVEVLDARFVHGADAARKRFTAVDDAHLLDELDRALRRCHR